MTSTKTRGKRDDLYSLDKYIVKMHHSAAGTAWRWRTELLVLSGLGAALYWLSRQISMHWAAVVLAAALGIAFSLPWSRRFITRRFWCVLARHRFHRLCWEARLHTRAGRLPVVLWTRPTKVGERLFVWCRAGICADDFTANSGELAAACYAREARVTRNTAWSQIVTIDIIRRDTLAARHKVGTPLSRLMDTYAAYLDGEPSPATASSSRTRPGPVAAANCPPRPRLTRAGRITPNGSVPGATSPGTCPAQEAIMTATIPAPAAVPVFPLSIFAPRPHRHRRVRRTRARRTGRTQHAARRRARRRQILRDQPHHRARRAVRRLPPGPDRRQAGRTRPVARLRRPVRRPVHGRRPRHHALAPGPDERPVRPAGGRRAAQDHRLPAGNRSTSSSSTSTPTSPPPSAPSRTGRSSPPWSATW